MSKQSKVRIPKYRRHPNGQAFVQIKGERIYLGKFNTDESQTRYQKIVAQFLTGEPISKPNASKEKQSGITIVELISRYWEHCQKYYVKNGEPTSELSIIKPVLREFRETFGRLSAADFGPLKLKAFRQRFIDRQLARTTVNKYTSRIVQMYRWGVEQELIPPERYQALAAISRLRKGRSWAPEPRPIEPVDDHDVELTIPFLPPIVAIMVQLQRFTGMRPQEVCSLRPVDLDRSNDVWRYVPDSHKTEHHDKVRVVFIGPRAKELLMPFLLREDSSYCFAPEETMNRTRQRRHAQRTTPMSCGNSPGPTKQYPRRKPGKHYTTRSYRRAIHRACRKAGIAKWSPNRLRHTAATEIRREFGLESAQVVLGHSNAAISEIYAERDHSLGEKVALKLG